MRQVALTTIDNPYDPIDQFDDWYAFDLSKGYNCCEYVGSLALTSSELSYLDQSIAVERAVDQIVKLNVLGIFKKVVKEI